jgi:hypothetical protein
MIVEKLKLNPLVTIKSYFFEGCEQAVEAAKANLLFARTLVLFMTLPIWYPFAFVIAHLAWPGYQKAIHKARAEQMDRLFGKTQRIAKNTEQQVQADSDKPNSLT